MKSKKGISPLVATVLLLGFTVALAGALMWWGQGFTKDIRSTPKHEYKQVCSNQQLWDDRTSYTDFRCDLFYLKGKTIRDCFATDIILEEDSLEGGFNIIREEVTTTCLEVCINC